MAATIEGNSITTVLHDSMSFVKHRDVRRICLRPPAMVLFVP